MILTAQTTGPEHLSDAPPRETLRLLFVRTMCLASAGASAVCMVGWMLDIPLLRSIIPGAVEMKVNTALCLGALSAAICLRSTQRGFLRLGKVQVLGVLVAATGAITLLEYALDWNAHIDEFLFRDDAVAFNPAPGRMSPLSAIAFMLLGIGHAVPAGRRWRQLLIACALLTFSIGFASAIGYLLNARELITDEWVPPVAVNTAIAFCLLGAATLLVDPLVTDFWRLPRSVSSVQTKLVAGFGFALLLICASGAFTYRMQLRAIDSSQDLSAAGEFRRQLRDLYSTLVDAESMQRTYLLDAKSGRILQYRAQVEHMNQLLARLSEEIDAGDPRFKLFQQLTRHLGVRERELEEQVSVAEQRGREAAIAGIVEDTSTAEDMTIRALFDSMDILERDRIAVLTETSAKNRKLTLVALLATVAIAAVTLVLLFLSILHDLRERARVTQALRQAEEQARHATRAKSDFLAAMSHEIRTPMNGVIGMLDLLEQSSLQERQKDLVHLARESADSLLGIIEDILDFSKIEAGRMELEHKPLGLASKVERVCTVLDRIAERSGVQLAVYCDPAVPDQLLGDAMRVRQILINLVGNAIKFSQNQDRRGVVSVRMRLVELASSRAIVEIVVRDNGIGMDEETRSRLFRPFMQADVSTTRRFGGTGLGLAISRQLVMLMDGTIEVQSAPDAGTTFTMRLPFVVPAEQATGHRVAGKLTGIQCVAVGTGDGYAQDLASYLEAEGASVARTSHLPASSRDLQLPPGGTTVWVVPDNDTADTVEELLARVETAAGPESGIVLVVVGRRTQVAPATANCRAIINGNALTRAALIRAVLVASGAAPAVVEPSPKTETPAPRRVPTREEAVSRSELLLVAEDNPTNQLVIRRQLQLLGFAADFAVDGEEALAKWQTGEYGLVLTDLHMPRIDGYGLTLAIRLDEKRTNGRRTPIIALTANALPAEDERCRAAGMDGYLTKPATIATLRAELLRWFPGALEPGRPNPALDPSALVAIVGDDPDVLRDLLEDYGRTARIQVAEMEQAGVAGRAAEVAATAHKLKSSSRAVGAMKLGDLCETLERDGRAGELEALRTSLGQLRAEFDAVQACLGERLEPRMARRAGA